MREDCLSIITVLEQTPPETWAETFVKFKMDFWRKYCMGLIFSTIHGLDFFKNVLACLDGTPWEPDKDEPEKGEYEENFRRFIKHYRTKTPCPPKTMMTTS